MAQLGLAESIDLRQLQRALKRIPADAKKEVVATNRDFAKRLATLVKPEIPVAGGYVRHGHPNSRGKGTKKQGSQRGAMRSSVRAFASVNQAGVRAGGTKRSEHFIVNELGGAVWWHRMGAGGSRRGPRSHRSNVEKQAGTKIGHIIPVRERSPMNPVRGDGITGERTFPAGWFFFKTAARHVGGIAVAHADAMHKLNERLFGRI